MNKLKKIFNIVKKNILTILMIVFLMYTAVTITYAPKGNKNLMYQYIVISVIGIAFAIKKIIRKDKIIKSKLDLCILGLTITASLPIIFNKAVCINDAVFILNQYIILFEFFVIIKQLCVDQPKAKKVLINVIILLTIILIFIGIDKMTVNILDNINTNQTRMESLFFSPNALATLIGGTIFFTFGQLFSTEKKSSKIIYLLELSILITGLILTYSRIMYVTFAMMLIVYYISNKEQRVKKELPTIAVIMIVCGMLFAKLYDETLLTEKYYRIWVGLITSELISVTLCMICEKYIEKIKKINIKKVLIFIGILLIGICIYFFSVKNISKPLEVFNQATSYSIVEKTIYGIKGNSKYVLRFDIESKGQTDDDYRINIVERNKYMDCTKDTVMSIGEFSGEKQVEITTEEYTTYINIEFESKNNNENSYLKINKVFLDDKEVILNYKYLPTNVMERFSAVGKKTKNAWERATFYKDALNIIKQDGNWIFGIGGNGWKYKYLEVQSYAYVSTDVHNYPLQILLEFGIIGFGIFVTIIVILIKRLLLMRKDNNVLNISVICAIFCMLFHSCFDYSMMFFYILLTVYFGLAIIDAGRLDISEKIRKSKILNIFICIVILITLLYNVTYGMYFGNSSLMKNKNKKEKAEIYEKVSMMFPANIKARKGIITTSTDRKTRIKNYKYLFSKEAYYIAEYDFLANDIVSYVSDCLNEHEDISSLKEIQEYFYKTRNVKKYNYKYQMDRLSQMMSFGNMVLNYNKSVQDEEIEKLGIDIYKDAKAELESKKEYMLDFEKGRFNSANVPEYKEEIEKLLEELDNKINI